MSAAGFLEILQPVGIDLVVDVRRYPGSRRHPHFGREAMEPWLADRGVGYRWMVELGGRRSVREDSPNSALRNRQFRAYADHMASGEFGAAVDALLEVAEVSRAAVMCAESVWWRCHRRLLADHLVLVKGADVRHLLHDGRITEHPITSGARLGDRRVVYDAE